MVKIDDKQKENYYEILKVSSDCRDKDIKDAYVKLSKQYHPDVKGSSNDQKQTARFVQISEAYQTLSKAKSRRIYDEKLKAARTSNIYAAGRPVNGEVFRPWEIRPNFDPNPGPYYGVKGFNRISNFTIAAVLTVLGIAGGIFGIYSVRKSYDISRKNLDNISSKANEHHKRIREQVQNSTREEQMKRFMDRVEAERSRR